MADADKASSKRWYDRQEYQWQSDVMMKKGFGACIPALETKVTKYLDCNSDICNDKDNLFTNNNEVAHTHV